MFRRLVFIGLLGVLSIIGLSSCNKNDDNNTKTARIGYQKFGPLVYLKENQILEKELASKNIQVKWKEFTSGPPMLEALNTGSIDFANTGETPPVFAQSGGSQIVYVAYEAASPQAEAILIPENSDIKTLADLKGKKIAVTKGSSAHYTLLIALKKVNLIFNDITPYYLQPSEARTAFERKKVDAWPIWEPFRAGAELQLNAHNLIDTTGLKPKNQFYLASKDFTENKTDILQAILTTIKKADADIQDNPELLVKPVAKLTRLPEDVVAKSVSRYRYGLSYMNEEVLKEQQKVADMFFAEKLIPKPIDVKENVWFPK